MSLQSNGVEIRQLQSGSEIVTSNPRRFTASESNLSNVDLHGESSQFIDPSEWLSSGSCRRDTTTADRHRVQIFSARLRLHSRLDRCRCVIATMCSPNLEFQLVNPTTQVALFALCIGSCDNLLQIQWNIYQGLFDSILNLTQWVQFNRTTSFENIYFFGKNKPINISYDRSDQRTRLGRNSSNFTSTNRLFIDNPSVGLWRFQVTYHFPSATSSSALNFVINRPPYNGSCSIDPLNGTTSTAFTVSCPDWFDEDGIKDYSIQGNITVFSFSLYLKHLVSAWTNEQSTERLTIGYSPVSTLSVRLPSGNGQASSVKLLVLIRDLLDCVTEVNISSVTVSPDTISIDRLINDLHSSPTGLTASPLVQLLSSGNQNLVSQVITAVSQQLNSLNTDSIDQATQSEHSFFTPLASRSLPRWNSAEQHRRDLSGKFLCFIRTNDDVLE